MVLISERFWGRHFGRDSGVVGRTLTIDDVPCRIVGVLPVRFTLPETAPDVWRVVNIDDLNAFLDWVQAAGQANGAPAGTALQTVRDEIVAADTVAPTTAISCDVGQVGYEMAVLVDRVGKAVQATPRAAQGVR